MGVTGEIMDPLKPRNFYPAQLTLGFHFLAFLNTEYPETIPPDTLVKLVTLWNRTNPSYQL